jgi:hypothetical protein
MTHLRSRKPLHNPGIVVASFDDGRTPDRRKWVSAAPTATTVGKQPRQLTSVRHFNAGGSHGCTVPVSAAANDDRSMTGEQSD